MKAVVCRDGDLEVTDIPDPQPGEGQVLLNVSRCGICGSDLHMRADLEGVGGAASTVGYEGFSRRDQGVVFGHEFCGEVVEYGPGTERRWTPGSLVVAMPLRRNGREPHLIGVSPQAPGGYAEQIVVQESMAFAVPNGLSAEHAVLTEPMAVGWHAVRRSRIGKGETAYVIGCGPIGLAVVSMLKAVGVRNVVASDLSPRRRELAARCGADVVVDPGVAELFAKAPTPNRNPNLPKMLNLPNSSWAIPNEADTWNLGFDAMEKLRRNSRVPWWYVFRAMHALNRGPSGPVVFECVGVPGMIDRLIADAPMMSRLVVVGSCLEPDTFHPVLGQFKEIDVHFSVGWDPGEFRDTLHKLADGTVNPTPLITGTVGLPGVDAAFTALGNPERHAKILIDPRSAITTP
jgi:threonine dehydrogenase-like Zn-dependent dehydrogenase